MPPIHGNETGKDDLTGLSAYDAFVETLESCIDAAKNGEEVSVALVDLDWFRKFNEENGSDAGDAALVFIARFLEKAFASKGVVFRYGADAFAVVLRGIEKEEAFLLVEQARKDFEGDHEVDLSDRKIALSIALSAGVASWPSDGSDVQDVVRQMNEAMYRAKTGGGNKVCIARETKMVTKTSHYTQGQLHGLSRLAERQGLGEAALLREALDDLLRKHNA